MDFSAGSIYHIYNRGNNKQKMFFKESNYIYFISKMRKYILPHCDILAYALMPNHFHFLIHADERTEKIIDAPLKRNILSEGIRLLLSSYTKGINKQEGFTGNLIQQTTRSKCVHNTDKNQNSYAFACLVYIHQNPLRAGMVDKVEKWQFSSYPDYAGLRNGTLCNKKLAYDFFGSQVMETSPNNILGEDTIKNIW